MGFGTMKWVIAVTLIAAMVGGVSEAVEVDFYSGNALNSNNPLNLAHVIISIGNDNDVNGPGSADPGWGGTIVRNGMPDGVEYSAMEYIYANPAVPHHANVVSVFDANLANLWATYGCGGVGTAFWNQHGTVYCDNFGNAPQNERICWDANLCLALQNPYAIRLAADQTVSDETHFYANVHYVMSFGLGAPNAGSTPFDFDLGMTVNSVTVPGTVIDRSLVSLFGASGDFDGDSISNLDEWNALVAAVRAITPEWQDPSPTQTVWNTIPSTQVPGSDPPVTSGRLSKDRMVGWYIDRAILNQPYDPPLFNLATGETPPPPPVQPATIRIKGGSWVEVGSRVEIIASQPDALGYQWFKDGDELGGEASNLLVIDSAVLADGGQYFCRITTPDKAVVDTPTVTLQVFAAGALPVAGGIGLTVLAGLCALAGGIRYARRR